MVINLNVLWLSMKGYDQYTGYMDVNEWSIVNIYVIWS